MEKKDDNFDGKKSKLKFGDWVNESLTAYNIESCGKGVEIHIKGIWKWVQHPNTPFFYKKKKNCVNFLVGYWVESSVLRSFDWSKFHSWHLFKEGVKIVEKPLTIFFEILY